MIVIYNLISHTAGITKNTNPKIPPQKGLLEKLKTNFNRLICKNIEGGELM